MLSHRRGKRKEKGLLKHYRHWGLASQDITCWWEVESNCFLFLCFCTAFACVSLSYPPPPLNYSYLTFFFFFNEPFFFKFLAKFSILSPMEASGGEFSCPLGWKLHRVKGNADSVTNSSNSIYFSYKLVTCPMKTAPSAKSLFSQKSPHRFPLFCLFSGKCFNPSYCWIMHARPKSQWFHKISL